MSDRWLLVSGVVDSNHFFVDTGLRRHDRFAVAGWKTSKSIAYSIVCLAGFQIAWFCGLAALISQNLSFWNDGPRGVLTLALKCLAHGNFSWIPTNLLNWAGMTGLRPVVVKPPLYRVYEIFCNPGLGLGTPIFYSKKSAQPCPGVTPRYVEQRRGDWD